MVLTALTINLQVVLLAGTASLIHNICFPPICPISFRPGRGVPSIVAHILLGIASRLLGTVALHTAVSLFSWMNVTVGSVWVEIGWSKLVEIALKHKVDH